MKRLLSIVLIFSLLVANIGFVKIGDSCCSKKTLAIIQPILSANCCCASDANTIDNCCSQINSFTKLSTDFEKESIENFSIKKQIVGTTNLVFKFNIKPDSVLNVVPEFKNKLLVKKPPGIETVLFYKLFNNYKLYC